MSVGAAGMCANGQDVPLRHPIPVEKKRHGRAPLAYGLAPLMFMLAFAPLLSAPASVDAAPGGSSCRKEQDSPRKQPCGD